MFDLSLLRITQEIDVNESGCWKRENELFEIRAWKEEHETQKWSPVNILAKNFFFPPPFCYYLISSLF